MTTIQDYTLFNILNDYSIEIWKSQIKLIMEKHGFMSFIVHPDYIMEPREVAVYRELLGHLAQLRERKNVWITTPGEVNRWWRQRAELQLVEDAHGWHIRSLGKREGLCGISERKGRAARHTVEESADDKPVCVPGTLTEVRPRN